VGLYMNPPDRAMVLCVDEKSQVQALNREFSVEVRKSEAVTLGDPVVPVFDGLGG
jgi:hypothetical protein